MVCKQKAGAAAYLRATSQAGHTALEDALCLLGPGRTRGDAARYILLLARLLPDLEAHVAPLAPLLAAYGLTLAFAEGAQRRRRDVAVLQGVAAPLSLPLPTWRAPLAAPAATPERLGALYVLEGARLGGKRIGRHFATTFGLTREAGLDYLLQPSRERLPWPRVCRLLDAELLSAPERHRAGAAARRCFGYFAAALAPLLVHRAQRQVTHAAL